MNENADLHVGYLRAESWRNLNSLGPCKSCRAVSSSENPGLQFLHFCERSDKFLGIDQPNRAIVAGLEENAADRSANEPGLSGE